VLNNALLHPPSTPIGPIPPCIAAPGSVRANVDGSLSAGCNTVLYAPSSPAVTALLQRVAANSGLDFDTHFVPAPGASAMPFQLQLVNSSAEDPTACDVGDCDLSPSLPECLPCALVRDNATLEGQLLAHPNSTQTALWFLGAYAAPFVNDLSYALLYNFTTTVAPLNLPSRAQEVHRALQAALMELAVEATAPKTVAAGGGGGSSGAASSGEAVAAAAAEVDLGGVSRAVFNYTLTQKSFPKPPPRLQNYDVFAANGGQWLFVVPALTFFHVLTELVHEKEAKLR
jgi:hypothetical protein